MLMTAQSSSKQSAGDNTNWLNPSCPRTLTVPPRAQSPSNVTPLIPVLTSVISSNATPSPACSVFAPSLSRSPAWWSIVSARLFISCARVVQTRPSVKTSTLHPALASFSRPFSLLTARHLVSSRAFLATASFLGVPSSAWSASHQRPLPALASFNNPPAPPPLQRSLWCRSPVPSLLSTRGFVPPGF
jgi:hypothetical protein